MVIKPVQQRKEPEYRQTAGKGTEYSYDEMNRLTGVMHDGQQLRSYSYDVFRKQKTERQSTTQHGNW